MTIPALLTVKQFSEKYPAFSEASLRWFIFNEEQNGFKHAVVRLGRRVLIDETRFFSWVDSKRAHLEDTQPYEGRTR